MTARYVPPANIAFQQLFGASPTPLLVLAPDTPFFTIVEVNAAYLRATMTERDNLIGRPMFEAFPDNPADAGADGVSKLRASLERALATRAPDAMQVQKYDIAGPDGAFDQRWWKPLNTPLLDLHGEVEAIIHQVTDVTKERQVELALRASEERLRFLDRLAEVTQPLADATEIMAVTARLLGEHLDVAVCAYADMEPDQDGFTIRDNWTASGAPSVVGTYSLAGFGERAVRELRAGSPLVTRDTLAELGPEQAELFLQLGLRATVCMPLVKEGRLAALMAVHAATPHDWTEAELSLVADTTQRSWAHIERTRSEAGLRQSEARFRGAVHAVQGVLWTNDPEGRMKGAQPGWAALTGQAPEEYQDFGWAKAVHPEDAQATTNAWIAAVAARTTFVHEHRVRRALDGAWRVFSIRAIPALAEDGSVREWVGVHTDVTDQRMAEEKLRVLNETLESQVADRTAERDRMWRTSPNLLVVLGFDGVFRRVNPAWSAVLGYEEHELPGTRMDRLVHPDDVDLTGKALVDAAGGPLSLVEIRCRHKDGSYRWIAWVTPSPEQGMIYATGRDVTAEKEQAAALSQTEEQLRQSQKMEAVGQLTGGVAHDFNNLLTIIKSSTDLLRRPGLADERRSRYLDAISDTVGRAAKLTGQLLAFARRQALKPEVFDAAERIRAIADMLGTIVGSRVRIETELGPEPCFVETDVSQFETALVNMVVNARDAMREEGVLAIRVRTAASLPLIRGKAGPTGSYIAVSIADTGSGISPDKLSRIFEPFYTTKEVGKGTGLGLSQAYGFAKQSGGNIAVESELGRGTTFTLFLPEVERPPVRTDPPAARDPEPPKQGQGRRVLVVEDNVGVGTFSTQLLQDLGYQTTWAANAAEALLLIDEVDGFDVVFSDVVMPGMSGVELGQEIRRRRPGLPVVLTSGYSNVLAEEGRHGFDLLQKPYAAEELSRILLRATRRGLSQGRNSS